MFNTIAEYHQITFEITLESIVCSTALIRRVLKHPYRLSKSVEPSQNLHNYGKDSSLGGHQKKLQ